MIKNKKKLIEVKNVSLTFNKGQKNEVKALNNISFDIYEGEVFGLVGGSGSGKTTLGQAILRLHDINQGQIVFNDDVLARLKGKQLRDFRKNVQLIFQDPRTSLNDRMKIKDIVAEGLSVQRTINSKVGKKQKVEEILSLVGLDKSYLTRYPHEISGGQGQRVGIARALAVDPQFIVADEPISALDVTIQAQIVNLMKKLQDEKGLTYLFIAHDLSMVKYISDRVGVMHLGEMVEIGSTEEIYNNPIHPYTKSLLASIPKANPEWERNRIYQIFEPKKELDNQERKMREITPGHFVLSTIEEVKDYRRKLG